MRYLLDTNALIWWAQGNERVAPDLRAALSDPSNQALFSDVSLWEVAIKRRKGRLPLDPVQLAVQAEAHGYARLAISLEHIARVPSLPGHHEDPFDHLLIAQAIVEQAVIVTADRRFHDYPVRLLAL